MAAFIAIVKKELSSVFRDRTIIIAIMIQLFIASFSSVLLISMLTIYDADSAGMYGTFNIGVGLIGPDSPSLSGYLEQRGVKVTAFTDFNAAQTAFNKGEIQAILVLPGDPDQLVEMKLYLPAQEAVSSMILNYLQEPLKLYENELRQERGITVRYTDLEDKGTPPTKFEFIYSVILPILMFFPAFIAGGMVIDSLSEEIENLTLDTLLSGPLSLNNIINAKITAALILSVVQAAAWLGLLHLNGITIHQSGWVLLLSLVTAGLITVGTAFITLCFHDRERSQFVYSLSLLLVASASLLINLSPIKTLSQLAVGDYYTHGTSVLVFAAILTAAWLLLMRISRFFRA